jgi:hypothetical protein
VQSLAATSLARQQSSQINGSLHLFWKRYTARDSAAALLRAKGRPSCHLIDQVPAGATKCKNIKKGFVHA